MRTFHYSTFCNENSRNTLPTPSEIRAISKKSGKCHISFNYPSSVKIPSFGLLVKYRANVTVIEAQTQIMLHEYLKDQVPIPTVFAWAEDGGQVFIYMSLIDSETLQERWSDMNKNERQALEQDSHSPYIRSLSRPPLNKIFLSSHPELTGPFQDTNAVQKFQDAYRIKISEEVPIIFTHDDFVPPNILLSPGPNPGMAAIIDWGQAGWYPAYWEYCKARRRTKYLPMILHPVDEEAIYHPWLHFVLSKGI
ncbi:kinase-like protein [Aspergillus alliaceus]|uniref:kinase-like protein n=1 Tax=Petromyces alliaceus TaxID=209559 RepID=UPI0012A5EDE6|nr:kinase-like protein [Aspergillus alliaceus]KAB8229890.1 kinase-like protein [Aspergillus alliaceus]